MMRLSNPDAVLVVVRRMITNRKHSSSSANTVYISGSWLAIKFDCCDLPLVVDYGSFCANRLSVGVATLSPSVTASIVVNGAVAVRTSVHELAGHEAR